MADDINTAINSGGYVIVPEKAVDGAGKDAIYVYMTYNSNGNQAWKISGGLNGGFFAGFSIGIATMLLLLASAGTIILTFGVVLTLVLIILYAFLALLINIATAIVDEESPWEVINCAVKGFFTGFGLTRAAESINRLTKEIAILLGISLIYSSANAAGSCSG